MNYIIPQWEERTSYGMRRIDPYAKLFEERIIFLGTPISDDVANAVMSQLICLESMDPDRDIESYINSPGGSFTALTAIYDTMQYVKPDICTICMGQAASMGALLGGSIVDSPRAVADGGDVQAREPCGRLPRHRIEHHRATPAAAAQDGGQTWSPSTPGGSLIDCDER